MSVCQEHSQLVRDVEANTQSTKSAHHRIDDLKNRVDKIEKNQELLHEMNTNIKLIAEQNKVQNEKMDNLSIEVKEQGKEIKSIKEKPAEDWGKIKTAVITCVLTTIAIAIISNLDLLIRMLGGD
ncbi:MAG: hypothetical protein AB7V16_08880 [Vulcanibacillus sp.]